MSSSTGQDRKFWATVVNEGKKREVLTTLQLLFESNLFSSINIIL